MTTTTITTIGDETETETKIKTRPERNKNQRCFIPDDDVCRKVWHVMLSSIWQIFHITDTACMYSTRSRVYETVKRPSVRTSVCPIDRQQKRLPAGLLLSVLRVGDRSTADGRERGKERTGMDRAGEEGKSPGW